MAKSFDANKLMDIPADHLPIVLGEIRRRHNEEVDELKRQCAEKLKELQDAHEKKLDELQEEIFAFYEAKRVLEATEAVAICTSFQLEDPTAAKEHIDKVAIEFRRQLSLELDREHALNVWKHYQGLED